MPSLHDMLAELKTRNPAIADRLSLSSRGGSIGLTCADTVFVLYSHVVGSDVVIDCRMQDGTYPTFPASEW